MTVEQSTEITKVINSINLQILECKKQITFLSTTDYSQPVTEEVWHQLCKTQLCSSGVMVDLARNIFPQGENFKLCSNAVLFDLMGFTCELPTTRCTGINVNTDWYLKKDGEPKKIYTNRALAMKQYFKELDNGASQSRLAEIRLFIKNPFIRNMKWWLYYRWKNDHREYWEKLFEEIEESYEKRTKEYYIKRKACYKKTKILIEDVLPILDEFSIEHGRFNGNCWLPTIDEIRKWENL